MRKNLLFSFSSILFIFLFANNSYAQTYTDNTPGTNSFVVPCDVTSITVEAWGAGGAGGAATNNPRSGSGGGGGGYSRRVFTVTPNQIITYTVGAGGIGFGGNGPSGGDTTILTLIANGGNGGQQNQGTAGSGGTASGGTTNTTGGNGAVGISGVSGGSGGNGANGGAGGAATLGGSSNGNPGSGPGGGGGGAKRISGGGTRLGGNGADGQISITYTSSYPNLTYCTPSFTTGVYPITNVNFAGINNSSSSVINGSNSYESFCSPTGTVKQGDNYNISVSGNTNGNNSYGVRLFADWNQDGDFLDTSETYTIGVLNNAGGPAVVNNINVPIGALTGLTKIRIISEHNFYPTSCRTGGGEGQIEDYYVNVIPATCYSPTNLIASAITGTTATVSWTASSPAPGSGYQYFISTINAAPNANTTPSGSVGSGITSVNLTSLSPGFTYYIWVRGNCGAGDTSIWSTEINFTTALTNDNCAGAVNLTVNSGPTCAVATDGTTVGATQSIAGCSGTNADDDVWYQFTATATSHVVTAIPSTLNDIVFQVFNSCGGTSLGCNNFTSGSNTETTTLTGLTIGNTYFVRVFSAGANGNQGTFTICVTTGSSPYCIPSSGISNRYINDYQTVGPLNNTVNLNTGRAATGYRDYTSLSAATQIAGGGVNIDITLAVSRQYLKAWVDWNNDGSFTDAAPELVYTSNGIQSIATSFGFVIPNGTAVGNYRLRVRSYENSQSFSACGNLVNGETEDYTISVIADCNAKITSVTDGSNCGPGTVPLSATASGSPSQFRWYDSETGGSLIATTATGSWTTPSLTTTTIYYVTAFNGCESLTRTKIIAKINSTTSITATPSAPDVCGENNIVSITATNGVIVEDLINETFEGAGLGAFSNNTILGQGDAQTQWRKETSTYQANLSVWTPAISSRANGNGFAFATSDKNLDVNVALESAVLSTVPHTDLTLSFRHYYSFYGPPYDNAIVEVSTDAGSNWTAIQTYTSDQGNASSFATVTANLNAYIGQANFKLRFRYNARFCDGWAIDDIRLYGSRPLNASFSWTGGVNVYVDPPCTIPYTSQVVNTVYIKPTASQLLLPTWNFSVTATLGNGCPLTQNISINNKTKVWQGATDNDWNNPNNWSPVGVPDINTCVIIDPSANPSYLNTGANGNGKTLDVRSGGILDIQNGKSLTIKEIINIAGTLNIQNNSSLVQIDNVVNTGSMNMTRTPSALVANDYVYWSSPTNSFNLSGITGDRKYAWLPTVSRAPTYASDFGTWANASGVMTVGKGYIVRNTATTVFTGTPNNGNISTPISRSNYNGANYTGPGATPVTKDDDNLNLIGNPYPSSINVMDFLTANSNIEGFVKVWTHGSAISTSNTSPFYQNFSSNYSINDYITYNGTGTVSGPGGFGGFIAAGQGFFVQMIHGTTGTQNVVFNNAMRNESYNNSQFYRNSVEEELEAHRIWLDLTKENGSTVRTLVGYVSNATNDIDRLYDATAVNKNYFDIYSINTNSKLMIQGRALPFVNSDIVPLGVYITQSGNHTIAIGAVDGLFTDTNQNIYLEDLENNIIHNLRIAPYSFSANAGALENRFVLRYTNSNNTLGSDTFNSNENDVFVLTSETLTIKSKKTNIISIEVYDVLGRNLTTINQVNSIDKEVKNLQKNNAPLLIKIKLENGVIVNKKIIF